MAVSPHVLLPHSLYLSFQSFTLPSPLPSKFLISSPLHYQRGYLSSSLLPQTLSISPSLPLIHSLPLLIIHSVYLNLFLSVFLSLFHPSFPPPLSLLAQPTASLSLGRGEQCQPTWGPVQSQLRRQGAPENTHNSVFQLGCRIKGSLTHG